MGTLIVMRYSTKMFADAADHTYVMCGTGKKAWGCWGGKTGGTALRQGRGSTMQADTIAEKNECAGITCYLINGVCHQAANRILFPAGITVRGARGYDVSEAIYGTYGRPRGPFGTCSAPFNRHQNVTGDLPECTDPPTKDMEAVLKVGILSVEALQSEKEYLNGILAMYKKAESMSLSFKGLDSPALEDFQLNLFMYKVQYSLGSILDKLLIGKLEDIRRSTEKSRMNIENLYAKKEMKAAEFVKALNDETIAFQKTMAGVLKSDHYKTLFGLEPGDTVILADPEIVRHIYSNE